MADNTENRERVIKGKQPIYWDDCEPYARYTSTKFTYQVTPSNTLRTLGYVKKQYCIPVKESAKSKMVPMNPQPSTDELLVISRKYSSLKKSESYRRRINTVLTLPKKWQKKEYLLTKAIYEYIGTFLSYMKHGLCKENKRLYMRVNPHVQQNIDEMVSRGIKASTAYKTLIGEGKDDSDDIRDVRQLYNAKAKLSKAERGECGSNNFSDHVMQVASLVSEGDSFVQSLIHENSKVPSVLLYTKATMEVVRQCCCTGAHREILGVDRTFNLGDVYVTVSCFKHPGLLRKKSEDHLCFWANLAAWDMHSRHIFTPLFEVRHNVFGQRNRIINNRNR